MKTPKTTPRQAVRTSRTAPAASTARPALPEDLGKLLAAYAETLRNQVQADVALEALPADADKSAAQLAVSEAAAATEVAGKAIEDFVVSLGQPKSAAPSVTSAPAPIDGRVRVRVAGPKLGRWRAGRQFFAEPVEIEVDAGELDALEADPKLAVSRL